MRDGHDRHAELARETRPAGLVLRARAGLDPRPLRIDDDPESLGEALAPLLGDLLHRVHAGLAVDRDRRGEREAPAEERDRQKLLLGDVGERREEPRERQRFPGRAVLRHHDVRRAGRNVFGADHAMADPADPARAPQIRLAPRGGDPEHRHARDPEQEQHHRCEERRDQRLERQEQERTDGAHRAASALSLNIRPPRRRPPSSAGGRALRCSLRAVCLCVMQLVVSRRRRSQTRPCMLVHVALCSASGRPLGDLGRGFASAGTARAPFELPARPEALGRAGTCVGRQARTVTRINFVSCKDGI